MICFRRKLIIGKITEQRKRALLISVTGAHVILMTGRKTLIYKEFGPVFSIS